MKSVPLFVCLLLASPAFGQTPRYNNADLGQPVSSIRVTPAEAAAILAPHQFQLPPELPDGPQVLGLWSSPTGGPFGEFRDFSPARRLDGTLLSDPQWGATTYTPYPGWRGGHVGGGSRAGSGPRQARTSVTSTELKGRSHR
jgi:hypothetical protein